MPTQPAKRARKAQRPQSRQPELAVSKEARAWIEKILSVFSKRNVQRWARQTGFVKRSKQLKSFDFLIMMVFTQMASLAPSLEAMAAYLDHQISRVALHYRFSREASEFLWACLEWIMQQSQQIQLMLQTDLLKPFPRVLIHDSSSWDLPPALQTAFAGSGGSASPANCKIHLTYELKRGLLQKLQLTAGKNPDQAFRPELVDQVQAQDLVITDLGFFSLLFFAALIQKQAYFVSRFLIGTQLWTADTLKPFSLDRVLKKATGDAYQQLVLMGTDARLPCRLIGLRVPQDIAQQRRRQLRKAAKKKGRTPSQRHLDLCAWTLLVTNAPDALLPAPKVRTFYRLRWQIELIFKQFKSILRIHHCRTTKKYRMLCELYGKLIAAVIVHSLHGQVNAELWNRQHQQLSFDKFWKRFQERALTYFQASLISLNHFLRSFLRELPKLLKACLKCRQPSRLTSLQQLETVEHLNFEAFPI